MEAGIRNAKELNKHLVEQYRQAKESFTLYLCHVLQLSLLLTNLAMCPFSARQVSEWMVYFPQLAQFPMFSVFSIVEQLALALGRLVFWLFEQRTSFV